MCLLLQGYRSSWSAMTGVDGVSGMEVRVEDVGAVWEVGAVRG